MARILIIMKGRFEVGVTLAVLALVCVIGIEGTRQSLNSVPATESTSFFRSFADLHLVNQEGRAFDPATDLDGKIVLVNFVFTGCSTSCPTQMRELAALQQSMPATTREAVRFVSISIDPLNDTPAALKAYGRRMGIDASSWTFATGRPQDVDRLAERLRLFRGSPASNRPEDHTTALWLVDRHGRLMQRYAGQVPDTARLAREIAELSQQISRASAARTSAL